MARDCSPIDQQWVQHYCDEFIKIAGRMPEGVFKQVILRRVECCMDLLEAWQKRDLPHDTPEERGYGHGV